MSSNWCVTLVISIFIKFFHLVCFFFLYRALLYGGMKESQLCEIELKDTPLTAFKHLLRYIYMGHMTLGNQKDELILEILGLAHK